MKTKGEKIALVAAIIIVLFYIAVAVTSLTLGVVFFKKFVFITKESMTAEKFVSVMKEEGFTVTNLKDDLKLKEYDVKDAYSAKNDKLTIEFCDFNNYEDAEDYFTRSKGGINTNTASKQVSLSGRNYEAYTVVKMGKYTFIEIIDNTVIIVKGGSNHENDAKKIIENFGY